MILQQTYHSHYIFNQRKLYLERDNLFWSKSLNQTFLFIYVQTGLPDSGRSCQKPRRKNLVQSHLVKLQVNSEDGGDINKR